MNKLLLILAIVGFGLFLILSQDVANAVPLDLNLQPSPEILIFNDRVFYQSPTEYFIAKGQPLILTDASLGGDHSIQSYLYDYSLEAFIDSSGVLSSGTLLINGTIPELGFNSGNLLSGEITEVGFGNSELDPLEFKFVVTSGDASSLYGGIGSTGGIVFSHLISPNTFATSFIMSQDNSRVGILEALGGQADGGTKPEPEIVKPEPEKPPVTPEVKPVTLIPEWIKNQSNWWVNGVISDSQFIQSIQYLMENEIIIIPNLPESSQETEESVPPWFKQSTKYWLSGQTTELEFANSLEYLVKKGIIRI